MQLKELYRQAKENMKRGSVENPSLEASILLSKASVINNLTDVFIYPEKELRSDKIEKFRVLLERRLAKEPVAYITGEKEFYSRTFTVTSDVLIPRPETELLVEETLKAAEEVNHPVILDIGTGSGCIAVTLACELPECTIYANDISLGALTVAKRNALANGSTDRIKFINGDLSQHFSEGVFDIVVSNPPYISESEFSLLEPDVREYEPRAALLAGEDGLFTIRKIISGAGSILKDGGFCLLEVGAGQSGEVKELFKASGFREISALKDIANIERVVKAKWKK